MLKELLLPQTIPVFIMSFVQQQLPNLVVELKDESFNTFYFERLAQLENDIAMLLEQRQFHICFENPQQYLVEQSPSVLFDELALLSDQLVKELKSKMKMHHYQQQYNEWKRRYDLLKNGIEKYKYYFDRVFAEKGQYLQIYALQTYQETEDASYQIKKARASVEQVVLMYIELCDQLYMYKFYMKIIDALRKILLSCQYVVLPNEAYPTLTVVKQSGYQGILHGVGYQTESGLIVLKKAITNRK
ncbi:TPA: hypothetical protein VBX77_001778 [Yersinia enterocolitica]|nr:hypothetical protein [Yersinia enterocolitica]